MSTAKRCDLVTNKDVYTVHLKFTNSELFGNFLRWPQRWSSNKCHQRVVIQVRIAPIYPLSTNLLGFFFLKGFLGLTLFVVEVEGRTGGEAISSSSEIGLQFRGILSFLWWAWHCCSDELRVKERMWFVGEVHRHKPSLRSRQPPAELRMPKIKYSHAIDPKSSRQNLFASIDFQLRPDGDMYQEYSRFIMKFKSRDPNKAGPKGLQRPPCVYLSKFRVPIYIQLCVIIASSADCV